MMLLSVFFFSVHILCLCHFLFDVDALYGNRASLFCFCTLPVIRKIIAVLLLRMKPQNASTMKTVCATSRYRTMENCLRKSDPTFAAIQAVRHQSSSRISV